MSTSKLGGRVRFAASQLGAKAPVSAVRVQNLLANNGHHYADQKCNHLVNWVSPRSAILANAAYRTAPVNANVFTPIATYVGVPITLRADRRPYHLRVRIAGAASVAGTNCTFGIIIAPDLYLGGADLEGIISSSGWGASFGPTSSTTPAWLSVLAGSSDFDPAPIITDRAVTVRPTFSDTGGSNMNIETFEVCIGIYSKTANNIAAIPRLHGVHVSEYCGA